MKVAIYTRVSTTDQDTATQEKLCKEYCQRLGYEIYGIYSDNGISGAYIDKSGSYAIRRPSFEAMLKDMRSFKFHMILCTKLDRIGRSLQHLLSLFDEFSAKGVQFCSITQNIDTSTATGKLMMQILGAFAEFERNIIAERTREGLKYAHNVGKRGADKKPRKRRESRRKPSFTLVEK